MPRSTSPILWGSALALLTAWETVPAALAQANPDKARDAILKEVEAAERRRQAILESLKRDQKQRAVEQRKVAERNAALPLLVVVRPGQNAAEEDDEPVAAPQRPIVILSRARIDQMLFGSSRTEAARASDLESILEARIASAERDRPLSDPEKKKLQLAGRGDIKYLLDRVEEVRAILDGNDRVRIALDDYPQLVNELRPLRATFSQGPFGDGSLFAKALRTIRQREQDAGRGAR